MKKILSKSVACILVLVLLVSCIPAVTVSAASEYPNTHVNTGNMAADLVSVAVTQAGYCEGSLSGNPSLASSNNYQKYGLWYDNNVDYIGVQRAAWCAAFVSWCANQAGIPSSIVYYHAYCPYGVNWFKNQGRFQYAASRGGSYIPKQGDIVYFAPAGSSTSSHIGIVRYVSGGYVYTVEGNTSGQNGEVNEGGGVFLKAYALSYSRLYGYGTPNYQDNSGHKITFDSNGGSSVSSVSVKDGETLTAPSNPTRYGFNFVGWYCNPELTDPYDYSMKVKYGFTLYAKWEEAYWGANTDLMPVDGLLKLEDYQNTGQNIWPYYNNDGSVTLYNGVTNDENHSWPSAYMTYENSFDSSNDAYIYVKYNSTAKFNAIIDYLDADGNAQSAKLSQIAGRGDEDFPAGYNEFFVNFGNYAYQQGHLTTSDGSTHSLNIKYTKVTYYVIGELDSYVRLYDMKLTPAFAIEDPYVTLYGSDIEQIDGSGSYVYNNGSLNMTADSNAGYSIKIDVNKTIDPTDMSYLLTDIVSNTDFNISMEVTRADGDATIEVRKEFYPEFGLAEAPDALPKGTWQTAMDLNGYYYWNGGNVTESTVKSVTITLTGKGSLNMNAFQANRGTNATYVNDGQYSDGSFDNCHTIKFVTNGGTEVPSDKVKDGATLKEPVAPEKEYFTFAGWYCNQELTDLYDFNTPVKYGFNLYAKWEEEKWDEITDLMPVEDKLVLEDFQGTGQYIWPYYNDDGSVTMYNGVTNDSNYSWPSAYMTYENSVDVSENDCIYVKYRSTAKFNATIDYIDAEGKEQSVLLSELAGKGTDDFEAGEVEMYLNLSDYLAEQGHLSATNNVKITKCTYYVVGELDSYVRIYDMKFTKEPKEILAGDVNLDGVLSISDATLIQQYCAALEELSQEALIAADINGDGNVNIYDATKVQRKLAKLE